MKKLLFVIIIGLLLAACSKETEKKPDIKETNEKVDVVVSVEGNETKIKKESDAKKYVDIAKKAINPIGNRCKCIPRTEAELKGEYQDYIMIKFDKEVTGVYSMGEKENIQAKTIFIPIKEYIGDEERMIALDGHIYGMDKEFYEDMVKMNPKEKEKNIEMMELSYNGDIKILHDDALGKISKKLIVQLTKKCNCEPQSLDLLKEKYPNYLYITYKKGMDGLYIDKKVEEITEVFIVLNENGLQADVVYLNGNMYNYQQEMYYEIIKKISE